MMLPVTDGKGEMTGQPEGHFADVRGPGLLAQERGLVLNALLREYRQSHKSASDFK